MQTIFKNEDEGGNGRRAGVLGIVTCTGRDSRHMERECDEELEAGEMEYETVEELLTALKKEFGEEKEEAVKMVELRRVEQGGKTMEEYVQEFKRIARGSGYKGRPLVEEFKRGMNRGIRRKLMEAENPLTSIEQ